MILATFVKRFALRYRTVVLSVCLCCLSVTATLVYRGQTVGWIKMPLGAEVGLARPRPHYVRWEPNFPLKGAQLSTNFRPMSIVVKRSPISATAEHLLANLEHKILHLSC